MKKIIVSFLLLGFLGLLHLGVFPAAATLEVSRSVAIHAKADFYAPLAPHGVWIEAGSYGQCWRPAHVAVGWRPYCAGHWAWTDCGWYWVSAEPWAWACYHYGWWVYDPVHAWIWVPGIEWAPAWVSWRFGGGYCGWAPLPPPGGIVAPSSFVFVEAYRFHEPIRPNAVVVNNAALINKTAVINNMKAETRAIGGAAPQKVMFNEGPGLDPIQKATGSKFSPVPIEEVSRQTPVPPAMLRKVGEPETKAPATPEQPKSAPATAPAAPGKSIPPEPKPPSSKEKLSPDTPRAPLPSKPPAKPQSPSKKAKAEAKNGG